MPSMKAATTEHTAPEIIPTTMSLKRHTLGAFPARVAVSSPQAMRSLGEELASLLRPGDVVAVEGALGSGKTTLIAGVVTALSPQSGELVTSPTFTFWHRYPGVEHLDLYRLNDETELNELGLEDAFTSHTIALVEWPERAPQLVGRPEWHVTIDGSGERPRTVTIDKRG